MLLSSVILVLREVLEAAVLISVLLALGRHQHLGARWLRWAVPVAAVGALWFASALEGVTDALDGAGQEVANAGLQLSVYGLVLAVIALSAGRERGAAAPASALRVLMALALICAMVREGSEVALYIAGFAADALRASVFTGAVIGAGIGVSLGILLYAALGMVSGPKGVRVCLGLLSLIGAGMVMQASMLLEQVDWLPTGPPVWDSSGLLSEQSLTGQLMYAVFGYESSPGALQVTLYVVSLALLLTTAWLATRSQGRRHGH